jgi:hypothetical protein
MDRRNRSEYGLRIAGRPLRRADLAFIRRVIAERPDWSRWHLSRELARRLNWVSPTGQLKDIACRELLVKLDRRQLVPVPKPRRATPSPRGRARAPDPMPCDTTPIHQALPALQPIQLEFVERKSDLDRLIRWLLITHHYLGLNRTVGAALRYLAKAADGRLLACALWSSAAWKTAPRDKWIGWTTAQREAGLQRVVNNSRFLILPWVRVPHLASHLLGLMTRRILPDWRAAYGIDLVLAETFVDTSLYAGTCYKAAGWRLVGTTTGRTRQDRFSCIQGPRKSTFVKPLCANWRRHLLGEDCP